MTGINTFQLGKYARLVNDDCITYMQSLSDNFFDAIVTDPPYALSFMGKEWDTFGRSRPYKSRSDLPKIKGILPGYGRGGRAESVAIYRNKSNIEYQEFSTMWGREAFRILKPGAYLLAFGSTRTFHRLVSGLEDAGFQIRDTISWIYGQGMPKSHNISKAIDKKLGKTRNKIRISSSHIKNPPVLVGGVNKGSDRPWRKLAEQQGYYEIDDNNPISEQAKQWDGWGTALKPAQELIVIAQKPIEKNFVNNVLKHGVGGLNIDACRISIDNTQLRTMKRSQRTVNTSNQMWGFSKKQNDIPQVVHAKGRWPANIIHDGSDVVQAEFAKFGITKDGAPVNIAKAKSKTGDHGIYGAYKRVDFPGSYGGQGLVSRFFYCAKITTKERNIGLINPGPRFKHGTLLRGIENTLDKIKTLENTHPTVKPIALMEYLIKLVTPPNGIILDPFMGSGTTGCAAAKLHVRFLGIEKDPQWAYVSRFRIAHFLPRFTPVLK